jgi:hypothetical protein
MKNKLSSVEKASNTEEDRKEARERRLEVEKEA